MQLNFFDKNSDKKKIVNVASVPQRSLFRYPGGKTWFVPTFRKWMSSADKKPKVLLEPFTGGGIIGLTAAFEDWAEKVILVELDENVAAVWETIIHGDHEGLAKRILNFELNFDKVQGTLAKPPRNIADRAFHTILRNRVSHGGIMAEGSGLIKSGENGKGIASRWYPETLAKRISEIGTIRHKISFIHGSAFDAIPQYAGNKDAYIFVDPPYTAAGKKAGRRLYTHHQLDHEALLGLFRKAKASFLFTYDDSEELRALSEGYGYQTALIPMKNTHHAEMEELIVGKDLAWLIDN